MQVCRPGRPNPLVSAATDRSRETIVAFINSGTSTNSSDWAGCRSSASRPEARPRRAIASRVRWWSRPIVGKNDHHAGDGRRFGHAHTTQHAHEFADARGGERVGAGDETGHHHAKPHGKQPDDMYPGVGVRAGGRRGARSPAVSSVAASDHNPHPSRTA